MVRPPFPFSAHLWLPLTPSASTLPLPPSLRSNSKAYLHNLCNYITPTFGLTTDQYWTCSDLVPMPRAAIYIPFLHLSYLPDPFCRQDIGLLQDLPPGPRFKGPSKVSTILSDEG